MGTRFRFITDDALAQAAITDGACPRCHRPVPLFKIRATVTDNDELDEVESLCEECIKTVRLHELSPKDSERLTPSIIDKHYTKGTLNGEQRFRRAVELCDEFRRTPDLPMFIQWERWPSCCGEFAEYIGRELLAGTSFEEYSCWAAQDALIQSCSLQDFYPLEKITCYWSMALFRCLQCPEKYWVFQYSGALWPGPRGESSKPE
jgi:hypothetical protein